MKQLFTLIALSLTIFSISGQNFEGKITYSNTYKSKTPEVSDQQYQSMMGNIQEYYIKGGNYKSTLNGTVMQWMLYLNSDNKMYMKMSNNPNILWNDATINETPSTNIQLNKGVTTILNYPCDEVIITTDEGIQRYYFSPELKVDANLFNQHAYGNFYDYIKTANAMPLKIIFETEQYTLESVATEVKAMVLDNTTFTLPKNTSTIKNPYR